MDNAGNGGGVGAGKHSLCTDAWRANGLFTRAISVVVLRELGAVLGAAAVALAGGEHAGTCELQFSTVCDHDCRDRRL